MSDVARAAGVSRTTASFVLNGRDASIPIATRQRVQRAAEEMGYRRHAGALALATGQTHRIGILLNEPENFSLHDPYFVHILKGVYAGALHSDYNLLLYAAHYPDHRALCDGLLSGAADGVLLTARYGNDQLSPALLDAGLPCVCVSFGISHPRCYAVDADNYRGGKLAMEHLIALGHRQFMICYPGESVSWGNERFAGALHALRAAGIPEANLHSFPWSETCPPSPAWVGEALQWVRAADPPVTGVICCDEWRAQKLCESLPEIGLSVPQDISVISFNSTEASARAHPPLTSVWQPLEEIGEAAVGMLVALIRGEAPLTPVQRFPMRLDVRESTGPCAGRKRDESTGSESFV
jgi:DNA-binding LacI/PurR family transcriptional regulator